MLSKYSFIQIFLLYLYRPIFMSFHFTISLCIYLNIQLLPPNANLKLLNPLHRKILFLYLMIFTITKLTLYYCASIIIPYTEYSYPFTYFFIFTINEQISNFAQSYPANSITASIEAPLLINRYRFVSCSCFSCFCKKA